MNFKTIPRQLMLLLLLSVGVTVLASGILYTALRRSQDDSAGLTRNTITGLDHSYRLLCDLSAIQGALQHLLRLKDPDEIEAAIKKVEDACKRAADVIAAAGEMGKPIQAPFAQLSAQQKLVMDQLLLANYGLAYEKFLTAYTPQYETVVKEVNGYSERVKEATQKTLATQQRQVSVRIWWRFGFVSLLLILLMVVGWRIKARVAHQLQTTAGSLANAAEVLSESASQLSRASHSLAEGSSQQAAALEETGASLEEMSSVTRRNAENAQTAKELARQTRSAADGGSNDMQNLSGAVADIKLASDNIAKITRTIDEIAFQTNLLALNAAVEAARAGEAGMGFAVVADEVRALSQRCAEAAREIAAKIEDSITKSERGVQLNNKVAKGLTEIVEKARQVDDLINGIASASQEQSQGITQITTAVSQMDEVTQSNAATAEESASAAQSLSSQAESLNHAVADLLQLVRASGDAQASTRALATPPPQAPQFAPAPELPTGNGAKRDWMTPSGGGSSRNGEPHEETAPHRSR